MKLNYDFQEKYEIPRFLTVNSPLKEDRFIVAPYHTQVDAPSDARMPQHWEWALILCKEGEIVI